jgi:hypothetical protein
LRLLPGNHPPKVTVSESPGRAVRTAPEGSGGGLKDALATEPSTTGRDSTAAISALELLMINPLPQTDI